MTIRESELEAVRDRIIGRAERLLEQGTLVWAEGSTVAYAFVVPIAARDDLADAFGDLSAVTDP
jgi:hypothetical protein